MDLRTGAIVGTSFGLIAAAIALEPLRKTSQPPELKPTAAAQLEPTFALCEGKAPSQDQRTANFGTFKGSLSHQKTLRSGGDLYASFELSAISSEISARPPLNIAVVIDRSGSMKGDKIVHAREAARALVARLGPEDQVTLIQYDSSAQVLVSLTSMTELGKARMEAAIDGVFPAGSTNLHEGLVLGRDELVRSLTSGRLNRILLLSDGLANVGVTDHSTLGRIAEDIAAKGVRVSTIGVGVEYDEDLMALLAEHGRGQYHYVRDSYALQSVFDKELKSMQATVATGVELYLEPLCGAAKIVDVYGYNSRVEGAGVLVPLADLSGGDKRKIVIKLQAPSTEAQKIDLFSATLRYRDPKTGQEQKVVLALGAETTEDATLAEASADSNVMGQVIEVESARTIKEAAEAYGRGEIEQAKNKINAGRAKAASESKKYNAPAKKAMDGYDEMDKATIVNPFSDEGKANTKANKRNAMDMSK